MYGLLVLPKARCKLEARCSGQLHAWCALTRERLLSPRCGTREPAAPQLLEGRFRSERQLLYGRFGNEDCTIRNDALRIQNSY